MSELTDPDTARANAAYIVCAVNAHAALVDALRDAVSLLESLPLRSDSSTVARRRVNAAARAALALAREE